MAVCQSAYRYLAHRYRGQAPSHIWIFGVLERLAGLEPAMLFQVLIDFGGRHFLQGA